MVTTVIVREVRPCATWERGLDIKQEAHVRIQKETRTVAVCSTPSPILDSVDLSRNPRPSMELFVVTLVKDLNEKEAGRVIEYI